MFQQAREKKWKVFLTRIKFQIEDEENYVECTIGEQTITFLIDSGSPVTTIPLEAWRRIQSDEKKGKVKISGWTEKGSRVLRGYGAHEALKVVGSFSVNMMVKKAIKPDRFEEIFIVESATQALLGAEAAKAMRLLKVGVKVNGVQAGHEIEELKRFPSIPGLELSFDIDESVPPKKDFRYNIPQSLEASLNEDLEKLARQEIIEPAPTTPTWVSRLKAVTKANGETRWVVTMLGPNKAIRRVFYPMPSMDRLAVKMTGAKWFTKLDIEKAFFHVALDERSKQMTTFMTSKGPMRFTRLAFGVNCAPEAFQKIMEDILRGCEGAVVFIDDILIFAEDREKLNERTREVKERLRQNNLTLNTEKCTYEKQNVGFLGYTINEFGMRPAEDKVKDVLACRQPSTTTGVRSFLGLVTFMASFIPDLSELSEPLRRISGKTKTFEWGMEQQAAFEKLKQTVAHEVHTRGFFNEDEEIWLYTDASPVGLGAVLVQVGENERGESIKRPVAFASKALSTTEAKYPQTQREALAVVWGVEKFHFYLIGRFFNLVVDHQPLAFIFNGTEQINKRATTRAESFALRLSTYQFKVHVVGGKDQIADYLSRESLNNMEEFSDEIKQHELGALTVTLNPEFKNGLQAVTLKEVRMAAKEDEVFKKVREAQKTESWAKELQRYAAFQDELRFQDDILLRGERIIAPQALRGRLLRAAHLGHPGMVAMKRTLRQTMWWPGLDGDVENHVKQCKGCTMVARNDPPEPMTRTKLPDEPWEYLAIDFHSPNSLGVKLLVVTDYYSRLTVVRIMKETDAGRVCDQLEDLFVTYGYPACIRADNGPPFASKELKTWAEKKGITIIHSTPWAPWMNGEVEAQMKGIKKDLMIAVGEKSNWRIALNEHIFAYNRRVHPTTGEKPIEMLFKRRVRDLLPKWQGGDGKGGPDEEQARDRDRITKYMTGVALNQRRNAKESSLKIGDVVYIENKLRHGLEPRFSGVPFTIIEKMGGTVKVRNEEGVEYKRCTNQVKKAPVIDDVSLEEHQEIQKSGGDGKENETGIVTKLSSSRVSFCTLRKKK